jgi:putative nucleotidyltransferase with HDIG domain
MEVDSNRLNRLLEVIAEIANGRNSTEILALTGPETCEPVRSIAEAIGLMMVKIEAREHQLAALVEQLEAANQQIRENIIAAVTTMAKALATRDAYTEGHAERVSQLAGLVAAEMGLSAEDVKRVALAGLLHDIGKIGFPDSLFLPHEGKNSAEIVKEITRHPVTGAEILKNLGFLGEAVAYIRHHHERPDGRGYPDGLKGNAIPLGARIIAVADAFDAITTDRPYQKGRTFPEAAAILKEGAATKWDRECVAAFERIIPKIPSHAVAVKAPRGRLLSLPEERQAGILLEPGPPGGAKLRWLKPGIDFTAYKRLMLDRVVFFFDADSAYKGMDPAELKQLADGFHRRIADALAGAYPVVKTPAPDVARLRFVITDLKQNRPILEDITSFLPGGGNQPVFSEGAKRSWGGSGATQAELVILDAMTYEVIAAAVDEKTTSLKEKFTKWATAEDAFKFWADRLRAFFDQVHAEGLP